MNPIVLVLLLTIWDYFERDVVDFLQQKFLGHSPIMSANDSYQTPLNTRYASRSILPYGHSSGLLLMLVKQARR